MNEYKGIMPTKIELTLEQSQQGVSNDVLVIRWWRYPMAAEFDSLPHAHAQTTKTYYKHQDSRIKKAQELKTKGKLIQLMHTAMVHVQVKTLKIRARVQVSRPGELRRHL
ncbi:hypothetical protein Tco_1329980 [Tanacetum coccineum]